MRQSGSHLAALVALPVVFCLIYSVRLVDKGLSAQSHRNDTRQAQAVLIEARVLADSVQGELDGIRNQSLRIVDRPLGVLNSAIIHVAELEVKDGHISGVKQSQAQAGSSGARSSFLASAGSFFDSYLRAAIQRLDLGEIRRNGEAMLRVKRDPQHRDEWVAFAFPLPSGNVVLSLVDPLEAFSVFKFWSERSAGGLNRGYLITADGYVFTHSDRGLWGADFSGTGVYRDGIERFFAGTPRREGSAMLPSIDLNPTQASWLRIGALPLAVVVENVVPADGGATHPWRALYSSLAFLLIGTGLLVFGVYAVLSRKIGELELNTGALAPPSNLNLDLPSPAPAAPEAPPETLQEILARSATPPPMKHKVPLPEATHIRLPSGPQDEILPQSLRPTPLATAARVSPGTQTQIQPDLEAAIANLQSAKDGRQEQVNLRMRHQDEILLNQYEADSTKIKDLRQAASRLTAASSRIFEAPALFFGYHPGVHAAILQAHAGFPQGREPTGMSFPIAEAVLDKIFEVEHQSSLAAMAEFTPLHKVMGTHYAGRGFQAWAVTGFAPSIREIGGPRLLGVLVLIDSHRSVYLRQKAEPQGMLLLMLVRLLKATSLSYENALLSP